MGEACFTPLQRVSPESTTAHFPGFLPPIKVQQRGQAVLVFAFGMPDEARRLSWQEEKLPEQQEIPLSRVFPN